MAALKIGNLQLNMKAGETMTLKEFSDTFGNHIEAHGQKVEDVYKKVNGKIVTKKTKVKAE